MNRRKTIDPGIAVPGPIKKLAAKLALVPHCRGRESIDGAD
jgi:hypothetical protein